MYMKNSVKLKKCMKSEINVNFIVFASMAVSVETNGG